MSIIFDEKNKTFTLQTKNTTYQFKIGDYGVLLHLYYGKRVDGQNMAYLLCPADRGFSGNPNDAGDNRSFSLDTLPQEYPSCGVGDYRISPIGVVHGDGSYAADLRFDGYEIQKGKYSVQGMPALYEDVPDETQTLEVRMSDKATGLAVTLFYGVFEEKDVITRAAVITNNTGGTLRLTKALSLSLDLMYGDWDLVHFYGKHAMEREFERVPVIHGIQTISSTRGSSSHHHNPGIIICDKNTTEDCGSCYGFNLVYSGNFTANVEKDQINQVRVNIGLGCDGFLSVLEQGESFATPEAVMLYTDKGFSDMSHKYHRIYRNNLCRGKYKLAYRPILINNWEATYFDFDSEKIIEIAACAAGLGFDMLVLDDGWFGNRDNDTRGLGDWIANESKLKGGLGQLVCKINRLGLRFGIWFEPEMVSEDSRLYREHSDWVLQIPGRAPNRSRFQLVLDMSRKDVRDYLFDMISGVLESANIEYVKWDMNRSICDWYSGVLPAGQQGELPHRYVLGLYELLERITSKFPNVLFEGCSGGGGRFDPGMLYYHPQIWCSDNTDAVERLKIQYGTSFFYPISAVSSHVSAVPNHQTGRITSFDARGIAAMYGSFGYELDITKTSDEEKESAKHQILQYKKFWELIHNGAYYRLTSPYGTQGFTAWQFVSPDKSLSIVNVIFTMSRANPEPVHILLKGLDEYATYRLDGNTHTGSALMNAGLAFPGANSDYMAVQFLLESAKTALR